MNAMAAATRSASSAAPSWVSFAVSGAFHVSGSASYLGQGFLGAGVPGDLPVARPRSFA